jgi:very-short-patch-repair endonuclease
VAERLSAKGWVLQPQIGVSGFRIDLGVVDPDLPGAFLAGVECDGATYHRGATARDRDRLRQLVLERLGWRILRIWSTDWWTNAAREADRLHTALQAALDGARTARAAAPGEPIVIVDDDAPGALATADADDADNAVDGDVDLGAETAPAVTSTAAAPGATDGEATLVSSTAVAANSITSPALEPASGAPVAAGTVVSQRVGSFMDPAGLAVINSAGALCSRVPSSRLVS